MATTPGDLKNAAKGLVNQAAVMKAAPAGTEPAAAPPAPKASK